jgi:hypothetical protein
LKLNSGLAQHAQAWQLIVARQRASLAQAKRQEQGGKQGQRKWRSWVSQGFPFTEALKPQDAVLWLTGRKENGDAPRSQGEASKASFRQDDSYP